MPRFVADPNYYRDTARDFGYMMDQFQQSKDRRRDMERNRAIEAMKYQIQALEAGAPYDAKVDAFFADMARRYPDISRSMKDYAEAVQRRREQAEMFQQGNEALMNQGRALLEHGPEPGMVSTPGAGMAPVPGQHSPHDVALMAAYVTNLTEKQVDPYSILPVTDPMKLTPSAYTMREAEMGRVSPDVGKAGRVAAGVDPRAATPKSQSSKAGKAAKPVSVAGIVKDIVADYDKQAGYLGKDAATLAERPKPMTDAHERIFENELTAQKLPPEVATQARLAFAQTWASLTARGFSQNETMWIIQNKRLSEVQRLLAAGMKPTAIMGALEADAG